MNKNQKIFGGVILVIVIVAGLCYACYVKGRKDEKETAKNREDIKKNSTRIEQIESAVNQAIKDNPGGRANSTIGHLAQERKDLFQDQKIRIVEGTLKKGAEEALEKLMKKDVLSDPEAVSDLIEEPIESVISNEYKFEDKVKPSQDSDQVVPPKETTEKELATEGELKKKIKSKRGEDVFYKDIMKLTSQNANGVPRLSQHETEEFYKNISGYNNYKPSGKIFTPKFQSKDDLLGFVYQICKKHKLPSDINEKFTTILTENFNQFLGQNPAIIATYWARTMKNRKAEDVINDPHSIYIEP